MIVPRPSSTPATPLDIPEDLGRRARQSAMAIEAMKRDNELRASRDGRAADIAVRAGRSVDAGVRLAVITDG